MINPTDIAQARAFARQDGTFLGLIWIASFLLNVNAAGNPIFGLLSNILTISTPFFVAFRLKSFRDYALEGKISFRRACFYCVDSFFYASLLTSVVQFLYFRFVDMTEFVALYTQASQLAIQLYNLPASKVKLLNESISMLPPAGWASFFWITEIMIGIILSPIIAAVMKRDFAVKQK